jgi:DNA-binding SARP family transcriptional activator
MIHLSTLGPLSIDIGTTRLGAASPGPCAAMLYLTVERGKEISRRTLMELLYADASEATASHRLRQLLYRLG